MSRKLMSVSDAWLSERQSFYDRISPVYDVMSNHYEHASRSRGLELLGVHTGGRSLEIGYGTGRGLVELARGIGGTGRVIGLEISAGMQRVAAHRLGTEIPGARVDLVQGDARFLPFADRTFDTAFLSFTIEIFPDGERRRVLEECRRVLRPGGKLGAVALSSTSGDSLASRVFAWFHEKFPHLVDCQPINLREALQSSGFSLGAWEIGEVWRFPVEIAVGVNP